MTHLSWVAQNGMAHGFVELDKAMVNVISLVSFLWLFNKMVEYKDVHSPSPARTAKLQVTVSVHECTVEAWVDRIQIIVYGKIFTIL